MLPIYIYHKEGTFLYKTGLFHALMSHCLGAQTQMVKYVKNGHVIFGSAITLPVTRGNPQTTFYSPAHTILITLVFAP